MLYDEVTDLMAHAAKDFPSIVKLESVGKTYLGRDIQMLTIDATKELSLNKSEDTKAKAILMTGAHHARELISTQTPVYAMIKLLHGFVQGDTESSELLKRNKYMFIPMLNTDGCAIIQEQFDKTGKLVYKRKNGNRSNETPD